MAIQESDLDGEVTPRGAGLIEDRLKSIKLLAMDVDGVLTDAGMYYTNTGAELKKFNTRDGQGIAMVRGLGLKTAIITSEQTSIVSQRAAKLKIDHVRLGSTDKRSDLLGILETEGLTLDQVCYVGDDVNDVEVLGSVGLAVVVHDATRRPRAQAHYITAARGGEGAVREICELILDVQQGSV